MTWEQLFEESIASSLYLPEPDNSLSRAQKEHVNLPEELSEVSIAEVCSTLIACTAFIIESLTGEELPITAAQTTQCT